MTDDATRRPAPSGFVAPAPAEVTATVRPEVAVPAVFCEPNWPDDEEPDDDGEG